MDYIEEITVALTWLGFFAAVFLAYYYYLKFRNQERMKLIEKNVDLSEIYMQKTNHRDFPWYLVGFTLLGIGIAGVVFTLMNYDDPIMLFAFVFIFGALGLIIGRSFEKKKK